MSKKQDKKVEEKKDTFNVKPYLKDGVKEEDVLSMKEAFDVFDADKSGAIDLGELKNAIVALGLEHSAEKITNLLKDLDKNGDNSIDFEEFLTMLGFYNKDLTDEDHLKELYKVFAQSNGKITVEDFRRVASQVGDRYSDDELNDMLNCADLDKDGYVNWDEFKSVVLKENK